MAQDRFNKRCQIFSLHRLLGRRAALDLYIDRVPCLLMRAKGIPTVDDNVPKNSSIVRFVLRDS
jgi:hypothetical protein